MKQYKLVYDEKSKKCEHVFSDSSPIYLFAGSHRKGEVVIFKKKKDAKEFGTAIVLEEVGSKMIMVFCSKTKEKKVVAKVDVKRATVVLSGKIHKK